MPGLATVLVGSDPASQVYVRNKHQATEKAGMRGFHHELPATTPQSELDDADRPPERRTRTCTGSWCRARSRRASTSSAPSGSIAPHKDVDGFHPWNVGQLALGRPGLRSCTPAGVMELLRDRGVDLVGANAVVIGRSNIVGKPLALMLLAEHAPSRWRTRARATSPATARARRRSRRRHRPGALRHG